MRPVRLIHHTHWDREWYLPFEEFRSKLVDAVDLLLDTMDKDGGALRHFHLDGQTAMVDDYLSQRPERLESLVRHVGDGRLCPGPWVTLVDEFLVSGESIIRNLEDGLARARELGAEPDVAYLPDQFGHIGQMPQILGLFGLERTVVWRGVPSAVTSSVFRWAAPGGSNVKAAYLPFGYGQGARFETDRSGFETRLAREVERLEPFLGEDEPALVPIGDDHESPKPELAELAESLDTEGRGVSIVSYSEHLDLLREPEMTWTGELRSGARANLLPNTYGVRPIQKIERARAEHLLERYAEPLSVLVRGVEWPELELREAWGLLHLNGAHDSVCGCSTDEVAAAVDERTRAVTEIAGRLIASAFGSLASMCSEAGQIAFNPSPFERYGIPGLGWAVSESVTPMPVRVPADVDGSWAAFVHDDIRVELAVEDQGDAGDLYTFEPAGPPAFLDAEPDDEGGGVIFSGAGVRVTAGAWRVPGEELIRFRFEIDNDAADHRTRVIVRTSETPGGSVAMSPFELVERPVEGEGGDSEPGSRWWPARGFVTAGDRSVTGEGVFEYEVTEAGIAVTLIRCTGAISRDRLTHRKVVAGPETRTPGAQLRGRTRIDLGVGPDRSGIEAVRMFETFALEPLVSRSLGGGDLPPRGSLLEIDVPALSSIRRRGGQRAATVWNPALAPVEALVGDVSVSLGPAQIALVEFEPHLA